MPIKSHILDDIAEYIINVSESERSKQVSREMVLECVTEAYDEIVEEVITRLEKLGQRVI